jgi:FkbM family methyltransferase
MSSHPKSRGPGIYNLLWKGLRSVGLGKLGLKIASRWPFDVRATVAGGREMYVDLRSSIGRGLFATGTFDIEAIRPGLDALSLGSTFIDIGANVGFYSVLALDRVGPSGHIHCFEIDPRPLRALRKTVARLGAHNIDVNEVAVSDRDGILTFHPMLEHGHNKIDPEGESGKLVRCVRLDTWVAERKLSRVDVIKVDVEGAEKLVLEGARQTILRFKPLLLLEADDRMAGAFGYSLNDLVTQVRAFGYETFWLEGVSSPTLLAKPTKGRHH